MEQIVTLILDSGRSGLDMGLYILLPIMVVMLALMKLLDAKGVLSWISNLLAPVSRIFGIPGLGIFAMLKLLFVSFIAPLATFALMDKNGTSRRYIAATLAMVLAMSQANATFPLSAVGLNLGVTLLTSIVGGLAAAAITFYLLTRHISDPETSDQVVERVTDDKKTVIQILGEGGKEGMKIVLDMLPMLILAIFLVNVLKVTGAIDLISSIIAPALALIGLSEATVLPLVTKFIAGGTAFMGVTIDLMNQGVITANELNRMAGFATNPLDVVGVAVFAAAGKRVGQVVRFAVYGALCGMLIRGVLHLLIF
ncbi:nucleoside recognition domain-containing protein [uncultured Neptuniibacter sp.]|uniref:nucleoside recognition domain-containing protein n=1 Tax=uncultured Neptuniibacter sp. TaxID=502143 RepID=UPI002639F95A|nr:nucleoside recognition domain-containing protein [uncultured Neptuniibacter sp.]